MSKVKMAELITQRQGFRPDVLEEYYVRYYIASEHGNILTVEFNIDNGVNPFSIGDRLIDPAWNILKDEAVRRGWDISKIKEFRMPVEMLNMKCRQILLEG